VTSTPIAGPDSPERVEAALAEWSTEWFATGALAAIETTGVADDRGQHRWLLRLRGEEKEFITLWLTLRQRTVHIEAQLMPAPEERVEEVYRYLLTKNAELYELHLALGPEDAIYLVGRVPVEEITPERLDEVCGAALHYVDQIFPTAMSMGLGSMYRRRPRSPTRARDGAR
jgi:Putative bacterial sensory transduction regulator